jgi:F-box and WD-40 domain protein CDC4
MLTMPYQVLDFGASRDGVKPERLGRRIVVNAHGREIEDVEVTAPAADADAAAA